MAGVYYLFLFVFWMFVGLAVAVIAAILLFNSASRRRKSRVIVLACTAAPFVGLLWLAVALFLHAKISNDLAHQDAGMSGDPYVTLPNGYKLESGNTYDNRLVAPGFQSDMPIAGAGYVRSIIDLEIVGDEFVGTQYDFSTDSIRPFRFNMKTREFSASGRTATSDETLHAGSSSEKWGEAQTRARNDPNSFWVLFDTYRHPWPKYILMLLIILGEGGLILGVRRLLRTRESRGIPPAGE
jgi:hypothetical protein